MSGFERQLARFLRGEPIRARPASTWERLQKWIRRRPATGVVVVRLQRALVVQIVLGHRYALSGDCLLDFRIDIESVAAGIDDIAGRIVSQGVPSSVVKSFGCCS